MLILATGTISRSAMDHRECGFYIHWFLLIFCSSFFFFLFSQFSHPISSFSPTQRQPTHTAFQASPELLVLDVHRVVSQSDCLEGKQRLWVRLRGARATSETLKPDTLRSGKCCNNQCSGTTTWQNHHITVL